MAANDCQASTDPRVDPGLASVGFIYNKSLLLSDKMSREQGRWTNSWRPVEASFLAEGGLSMPSQSCMCIKYVNSLYMTHHTQTRHIFINVNVTLGPRHTNATGGVRSSCTPIYVIDSVLRTRHNTLASQGTGLKVNLLSNVCFTYYENIIALFSSGAQRCRIVDNTINLFYNDF